MKKLFILFTCAVSMQAVSQSFYKGALVVNAGAGLDAYAVDYHYQLKSTNYTKDEKNGAASYNINVGVEYGFNKWFGLGLRGRYDTYFTSRDSTTHSTPKANGLELALAVNAHVVHVRHFDLPIGVDIGYSHLNYHQNDIGDNQIYGNGSYFNLHINPRFYIGKFGFNVNMAIPFINYANMTSNNSVYNQYVLANWKAAGFSFGAGIQYRFFEVK
ncbi:MAG: hypothetical protein ABI388_05220 [Bacteroidia bacterium]